MRIAATFVLLFTVLSAASPAQAEVFRGTLEVTHGDDFRSGSARKTYTLVSGRRRMTFVPTRPTRVRARARVVVRGRRVGGRLVGRVSSRRELARRSHHVPAAGPRKVLVLLFNFASDTSEPWTVEEVRERLFTDADSTAAFYAEQSYGQTQLVGRDRADGDVHGWFTIAASPNVCDVNTWTPRVREAARDSGLDLSGYDHTVYVFPLQASCSWAGLGDLGDTAGGWSWLNGDISVPVAAHELGHNLGLHHASSYSCTGTGGAPVTISGSCTVNEYGDRFDVMGGYGDNHSHGWHLQRLGYLTAGNVRTITSSGTYTVRSAIAQSTDVQLLRIPRTRNPDGSVRDYYYLDFRTPGGVFDDFLASDPVVQGVSIRVNREPTVMTQTWLLDATPGSGNGFRDAALAPGETFSDGTVTVRTVGVSGDTATVEVTVPDTTAPAAPAGFTARYEDGQARLTWAAAADDTGVARYLVFRGGGPEVGATAQLAWDETAPPPGTYRYEVAAEDAAGNRGPRSTAYVTVPAPAGPPSPGSGGGTAEPPTSTDTTRPRARVRALRRGRGRSARIVLIGSARDDGEVARIELWIDGARRRRARGTSVSYGWLVRKIPRGRHRIVVRAYDASGNAGSAALSIRR